MSKAVTLDIDPTIIEKNLMITEESHELDSLFPKQENPSKLIKPSPVSNKMCDDAKLEKQNNDSDISNLKTNNNFLSDCNSQTDNNTTDVSSNLTSNKINSVTATTTVEKKSMLIQKELIVKIEDISSKIRSHIVDNVEKKENKPLEEVVNDSMKGDSENKIESLTENINSTDEKEQINEKQDETSEEKDKTTEDKDERSENTVVDTKSSNKNVAKKQTSETNKNQNDDLDAEITFTLECDYGDDQLLNDTTVVEERNKNSAPKELSQEKNDVTPKTDNISNENSPTKIIEPNESNSLKRPSQQQSSGRCLWVSGLSRNIRANDLKHHFGSQGRVIGAKVVSSSRSTNARCYGYIVMSTPEEADACIKNLHHSKLLNRFISIKKANTEKDTDNADEKTQENDQNPTHGSSSDLAVESKDDKTEGGETVKSKIDDESKNDTIQTDKDKKSKDKERKLKEHNKRRHENSEKSVKKSSSYDKRIEDEEKLRRTERYERLKEQREKERINIEQKRLRELQRRQRDEATKLERERLQLRLERERLQREKMELLRLEKEQLEKEREELRRQKRKIEEATRKKLESTSHSRVKHERPKSHRVHSSTRSSKLTEKDSEKSRLNRDIDKHRNSSDRHRSCHKRKIDDESQHVSHKHSHRDYKSLNRDDDYDRVSPASKYNRYQDDKPINTFKSHDARTDRKMNDFLPKSTPMYGNKRDEIAFEPPPPRISSADTNRFNERPQTSQSSYGTLNNRMRGDLFESVNSMRTIDRVSDRFGMDQSHGRMPSNDNIDLNTHHSRSYLTGMDSFQKLNPPKLVISTRTADRFDIARMTRDERRLDAGNIGGSSARYHENERDMRYRDQWYGTDDVHAPSKRFPPYAPAPTRDNPWMKNNRNKNMVTSNWESTRRYDNDNLHPPGIFIDNFDLSNKLDRH